MCELYMLICRNFVCSVWFEPCNLSRISGPKTGHCAPALLRVLTLEFDLDAEAKPTQNRWYQKPNEGDEGTYVGTNM